jgi:HD-GYP domain-containing protein (c-di-GMP phosphodiesterase class II)
MTFLAKLLCHKLQYTSEATLYKITLASLLCDVGLYDKTGVLGTKHQEKSVQILKFLKIPGDVDQIILHHHEYNDGSGPLKVTRHKIHPLAKVIRVTDEFTEILFSQKLEKNIIFQQLYNLCPVKFEQNLVRALDLCFKT